MIENGALLPTPFLDVSGAISIGGERGLLGLAFSPDYAVSRRFFVNFTDTNGNTVVARFKRSIGNPLVADPATRFDLRWGGGERFIEQPFANHNGGHLAFGPDGFLYVALGDGGSGGDPFNTAQRPDTLLGKLLRINVLVGDEDPEGYVVPGDNPFVDSVPIPALPEIWAFGLRNPWKFSFDDPALGGTGAMLIGDVGQNAYEEVDYQPPAVGGRNYGWRVFEGAHPYIESPGPAYLPLVGPIAEYDHTVGSSITGGFVYRGYSLGAAYRGRYFYGDFVTARVWSIALIPAGDGEVTVSAPIEHTAELGGSGAIGNISAFGLDAAGELYIVSYSSGQILKVVTPTVYRPLDPSDIDGDNKADPVVWRPSTGAWLGTRSSDGGILNRLWGAGSAPYNDLPVPGDYDGDGKTDIAVWRPSSGIWYIRRSTDDTLQTLHWGAGFPPYNDVPVPGDYDGDGLTDVAVWRPTDGIWYIRRSSDGSMPARPGAEGSFRTTTRRSPPTTMATARPTSRSGGRRMASGSWTGVRTVARPVSSGAEGTRRTSTSRFPAISTVTASQTSRSGVRLKACGTCIRARPAPCSACMGRRIPSIQRRPRSRRFRWRRHNRHRDLASRRRILVRAWQLGRLHAAAVRGTGRRAVMR